MYPREQHIQRGELREDGHTGTLQELKNLWLAHNQKIIRRDVALRWDVNDTSIGNKKYNNLKIITNYDILNQIINLVELSVNVEALTILVG